MLPAIQENIPQDTQQSSFWTNVLPKKILRKTDQKDNKPRNPGSK